MGFIKRMLLGGYHGHKYSRHGDYYHHKDYFFTQIFKHLLNRKLLNTGNILFFLVSFMLLMFFIIAGLGDVYNGIPVFSWLDMAWKYVMGIPVSEIAKYTEGEKLLTEAAKKIAPQDILNPAKDILTPAQQFIVLAVSLVKALLDEILGVALLFMAFILRALNIYAGRPSALFSWIVVAMSPIAAIYEYL